MKLEDFEKEMLKTMTKVFKEKEAYTSMKKTVDELKTMFVEYLKNDFPREYPQFKQEIEKDENVDIYKAFARSLFLNHVNQKMNAQLIHGKYRALSISEPFDYLLRRKAKAQEMINKVLAARDDGKDVKTAIDTLVAKGVCDRNLVPTDPKTKKPYPDHRYISSMQGIFTWIEYRCGKCKAIVDGATITCPKCNENITNNKTETENVVPVSKTIGGNFGDDMVNVKCDVCGYESYKKRCPNVINNVVTGDQTVCNHEKQGYVVEELLNAVGKECETDFVKNSKDEIVYSPKLSRMSNPRSLSQIERMKLYLDIEKHFNETYIIKDASVDINRWWNLHGKGSDGKMKSYDAFVAYKGFVYDIYDRRSDTLNARTIVMNDENLAVNQRLRILIPDHVWEEHVGRVRKNSEIVVIGSLIFWGNKNKNSDPRYANSFPFSIKASGVIVLRNEKPLVVEANVDTPKVIESSSVPKNDESLDMDKDLQDLETIINDSPEKVTDSSEDDLENLFDD